MDAAAAQPRQHLQPVRSHGPTSEEIAALSQVGLDGIAAIETGNAPAADWRTRAAALLDKQAAAEKAPANIVQVVTTDQPPADLLISITPGTRILVDAANSPFR